VPELRAEGYQPIAVEVSAERRREELEGAGEGHWLVPSQLPRLLHDGALPGRRNPQGRPLPRRDADGSAQQTLLINIYNLASRLLYIYIRLGESLALK
jgi:hypothetical protein